MILKQEKKSKDFWMVITGFFAAFILSIFSLDFTQYDQYKRDVTAKWMSQDLGFSQAETPQIFVRRFTNKLPGILEGKMTGFDDRPRIERIDFDIKFDDMQSILTDREIALENNILRGPTKVPAKLRFKGKTYKAKLRLKGDLPDHWSEARRMSFRVSLSGKNSIFGFTEFSIHKPRVRQHPHDQTYQAIRQTTGGLSSNHTYAHIFVNGVSWGVMNIEEHMTKELLEKSAAKESLIFRFGSEDGWYYNRTLGAAKNKVPRYRIGDNILNARIYDASKYMEDDLYRQWYSYIIQNRLKPQADDIYDIDKFSLGIILARVWNNTHTLAHSNSRYYFNPYTLKLEPITTDQGNATYIREDEPHRGFDYSVYKMYQDVLTHQEYRHNFETHYKSVIRAVSKSKPIFEKFHAYFPLDSKPNFKKIRHNLRMMDLYRDDYFTFPDKADFSDTERSLQHSFDEVVVKPNQAEKLLSHIHAVHYTDGRIEIYNLVPTQLDITDITVDGKSLAVDYPKTIPPYTQVSYKPQLVIQTSLKDVQDGNITITTDLHNHKREFNIPFTLIAEELLNPLFQDNANTFDFIEEVEEGKWVIKSGKWTADRPIYVQGDLSVEAGAEITFSENAYMIIHGDMTVNGTANSKVVFQAKDENLGWKGFYVLGGENGSKITHMTVKNTQALEDGMLRLTGAVTFYRTQVQLRYVKFLGTEAEDALNLVHSNFSMKKVTISHTRSDGFDGDFSNGTVESSLFEHIGGDALDYSGSNIVINNPRVRFVKDKAISVGEASQVTVTGGRIHDVGVAIASKDGSSATASNVHIFEVTLSPAMTYIKKPFYGAPSLTLDNSTIETSESYFRQNDTNLTVDGIDIATQRVDVETLYNTGVMKK